ncbi:MAG: MmgE/PrpD family protein [Rhizobiaceae bacterium]
MNDLSRQLADFVVASRWNDVPAAIRGQAVRSLLNGFGTALGGAGDQAVLQLAQTLKPFAGAPTATVIGHAGRTDMPTAAFLNAVALNVFDFDDTHAGTIIHPTAPVAPAVFALAEQLKISGAELLHAFVLGVEVECRIGNAVSPRHYDRGWHITSTCGVFGAAAAASKLLGLDNRQMLWALGNASAQAAGLVETLGFMAKSVSVGNAARNGIIAALMALNGVEGPPQPLEGPRGFLSVLGENANLSAITDGLGERWELVRNMFKPYPCGVVLNPVLDAALDLARDPAFDAGKVERITIRGNPLLKARTDRPAVTTGREAQVSAQHATAVALLRGSAGIADFNDAAVADPAVLVLRERVAAVEVDATIPVESAHVIVMLTDGTRLERTIAQASGSLARPMSDADLVAKFQSLAAYGSPRIATDRLLERLWTIEADDDAGALMRLTRPA